MSASSSGSPSEKGKCKLVQKLARIIRRCPAARCGGGGGGAGGRFSHARDIRLLEQMVGHEKMESVCSEPGVLATQPEPVCADPDCVKAWQTYQLTAGARLA